jgi:uncharacterized protein YndB with AHSA1/START domain
MIMAERSITHTTFAIERSYPVEPSRVFAAVASAEAKARWAVEPEVQPAGDTREFDLRVGGRERFGAKVPDGPTYGYDALYHDIVPDQRIVYCCEMYADGSRNCDRSLRAEGRADAVGGWPRTVIP